MPVCKFNGKFWFSFFFFQPRLLFVNCNKKEVEKSFNLLIMLPQHQKKSDGRKRDGGVSWCFGRIPVKITLISVSIYIFKKTHVFCIFVPPFWGNWWGRRTTAVNQGPSVLKDKRKRTLEHLSISASQAVAAASPTCLDPTEGLAESRIIKTKKLRGRTPLISGCGFWVNIETVQ